MSYQEIGLFLGKKTTQVKQKRETLGLCCKREVFYEREVKFIEDNYPKLSKNEISIILNIKKNRVDAIIRKLKINAKRVFFKHDYLSMSSIEKILNISITLIKSLIKCKFIRISQFKTSIRQTLHLIHIDEFNKIKDFLENYITVKDFSIKTFFEYQTIYRKVINGKIKDVFKVGSTYFIHKNEIEIMRAL